MDTVLCSSAGRLPPASFFFFFFLNIFPLSLHVAKEVAGKSAGRSGVLLNPVGGCNATQRIFAAVKASKRKQE